jgi:hypothetical protein
MILGGCEQISTDLLYCTLDKLHAGAHVATSFGHVVDTWCDDPEMVCPSCGDELVIPVTDLTGMSYQVCFCAPPLDKDAEDALVASMLARLDAA